jgi:hypothetical protein
MILCTNTTVSRSCELGTRRFSSPLHLSLLLGRPAIDGTVDTEGTKNIVSKNRIDIKNAVRYGTLWRGQNVANHLMV